VHNIQSNFTNTQYLFGKRISGTTQCKITVTQKNMCGVCGGFLGGTIQYLRYAVTKTQETPFFPFIRFTRTNKQTAAIRSCWQGNKNKHYFMFCLRHAQENNISSRIFVFMQENRG
jgi:hypothetical protein